ncbi:DUF4880 domain-containing protein [Burkholderia plantarii]|uniref:FecR family protein n=1 Tax=Burkholderia plantarii TaxID=41899 RepID=UPI00272D0B6C|nr:DUF4880 domain-containing protein [Burkholderia plantarii]WLE62880.1 DUF4880 domain-containing protein [Burkholderia plantarii]
MRGAARPDLAAIAWEVRLREGAMSAREQAEFDAWCRDPEHAGAWARLQARLAPLGGGDAAARAAAAAALRVPSEARRKLLRAGFGAVLLGVASWEGVRGLGLDADWRSGIGRVETVRLANGAPMAIDAGSRVYVMRAGGRDDCALRLPEGQVLVRMEQARAGSVSVETPDGSVHGLAGALNVGRIGQGSVASVRGGEAVLRVARHAPVTLHAGDSVAFSATGVRRLGQPFELVTAWTRGMYVADDVPLSDLIDVFNRYHHGALRVVGRAAGVRLSGVFMLGDIDAALRQVAVSTRVTISRLGPYLTVLT